LEKAQVVEALQEAALTDERDGTALLNPGHVLAAADADRATFDADRGGAKLEEMSGIAVAVVDIVQSPGPSPRSIRHQTVENRDADKWAAALRRVRIVLVCPRPAGLRIDRGSRGGDSRAQGATARSDLGRRPAPAKGPWDRPTPILRKTAHKTSRRPQHKALEAS